MRTAKKLLNQNRFYLVIQGNALPDFVVTLPL